MDSLSFLDRDSAVEALLKAVSGLPRAVEQAAAATSAQLEGYEPARAAQAYPDVLRLNLTQELECCERADHVEFDFKERNSIVIVPDTDGRVRCRVLMACDKLGSPAPAQSLARRMEYAPGGRGVWKAEPLDLLFDVPPMVETINLALTWRREGGGLALFLVRPLSGIATGDDKQGYWCAPLSALEPVVEPAGSDYPEDLDGYRMRGDVSDGSLGSPSQTNLDDPDFLPHPRLDDEPRS